MFEPVGSSKKKKKSLYLQSKTNEYLVFLSEWMHKSEHL